VKACPKCAEQVQDDAKVCRFCGAVLAKRNTKQNVLVIGGAIVGVAILASLLPDQPATNQKAAARERMTIQSAEIVKAYEANEAAAQARFAGKTLVVTGPVQSVDLDMSDDPVIRLSPEQYGDYASVYLVEADQPKAASLAKGQVITVTCQEVSEILGTPMLKDCAF
jgi:hypothetical protein